METFTNITKAFKLANSNKSQKDNFPLTLHILDGDLMPIKLTLLNDNVNIQVKKPSIKAIKWIDVAVISVSEATLAMCCTITLPYVQQQIFWTLYALNKNMYSNLKLYETKTKRCAFCNEKINNESKIDFDNHCAIKWRIKNER